MEEVVILHLKVRVSPLERPSQRVVENRDTHVEKRLYRPSVPAALLQRGGGMRTESVAVPITRCERFSLDQVRSSG